MIVQLTVFLHANFKHSILSRIYNAENSKSHLELFTPELFTLEYNISRFRLFSNKILFRFSRPS